MYMAVRAIDYCKGCKELRGGPTKGDHMANCGWQGTWRSSCMAKSSSLVLVQECDHILQSCFCKPARWAHCLLSMHSHVGCRLHSQRQTLHRMQTCKLELLASSQNNQRPRGYSHSTAASCEDSQNAWFKISPLSSRFAICGPFWLKRGWIRVPPASLLT